MLSHPSTASIQLRKKNSVYCSKQYLVTGYILILLPGKHGVSMEASWEVGMLPKLHKSNKNKSTS